MLTINDLLLIQFLLHNLSIFRCVKIDHEINSDAECQDEIHRDPDATRFQLFLMLLGRDVVNVVAVNDIGVKDEVDVPDPLIACVNLTPLIIKSAQKYQLQNMH